MLFRLIPFFSISLNVGALVFVVFSGLENLVRLEGINPPTNGLGNIFVDFTEVVGKKTENPASSVTSIGFRHVCS